MKIDFTKNGAVLCISLDGRLDTTTAPELESFLNENIGGADALNINCEKLGYVSSAGLRVLLSAQKKMKKIVLIGFINRADTYTIPGRLGEDLTYPMTNRIDASSCNAVLVHKDILHGISTTLGKFLIVFFRTFR